MELLGDMNVDYLNGEKKENFIDKLYISNEVINKMESTLDKRSEIIDNILKGNITVALNVLSDEFPQIQRNSMAYIMLVTQNFIEMLRSGSDIQESLKWLRDYTAMLVPNGPEGLEEFFKNDKVKQVFQDSCGLLAYEDLDASPLKDNLLNKRRLETAIVVNDTILNKDSADLSSLKIIIQYLVLGRKLLKEINGNTGPLYSTHDLCSPLMKFQN